MQRKARQGNCVAPASAGRNSELTGIQVKGSSDIILITFSLSFLCRMNISISFFSIIIIIIHWPRPIVCVKEGWEHGAQEEWGALVSTNVLSLLSDMKAEKQANKNPRK